MATRGSLRFHQGAWRIAVRAGKHADGSPRWVRRTVNEPDTAAGRKVAARVLVDTIAEADRLKALDAPANLDLLAVIDRYLGPGLNRHGDPFAPGTLKGYNRARALVAAHPIGKRPVRHLSPQHLTEFYRGLVLRHRYVAGYVHTLVRASLGLAVATGLCDSNPAAGARKPPRSKPRKGAVRKMTPKLIGDVLAFVAETDPYFHAWLRMAALTGARPSSIAGLRWRDVDLDRATVHYENSVVRGTVENPNRGITAKSGAKMGNRYHVSLDPGTVAALRAHRRHLVEHFGDVGAIAVDGWLFPRPHRPMALDQPVSPGAMSTRWERVREAYPGGVLADVRMYDLRHYVATQMISAGVDILTVANRLGHSDPTTTMRVYAEFLPQNDRAAANRLGADIDGYRVEDAG